MSWLVSIDPGVVCTGWALWHHDVRRAPGWRLLSCGLSVRPEHLKRAPLSEVASFHAFTVRNAALAAPGYVVVEQQQLSMGRDSKAPIAKGNDLLAVQAVGMRVAGHVGGELIYPLVSDWLGSASPEVTKNRVDAQLDEWGETEHLVRGLAGHKKSLHHNAYDAVGIGLWATGRYRSGHALPPRLALAA